MDDDAIDPITGRPYCTDESTDYEVFCDLPADHDGPHHAEVQWS